MNMYIIYIYYEPTRVEMAPGFSGFIDFLWPHLLDLDILLGLCLPEVVDKS